MGHVEKRQRKRKDGRTTQTWVVRYQTPTGSERSKTFYRKGDAEQFLAATEVDKVRGGWVDPRLGQMTFAQWAMTWLANTVHQKPKTRQGHESLLRAHLIPQFGLWPLGKIQPLHVRGWVAELSTRLSAGRVRQAHWLLSAIMNTAVEAGLIARTPCIGVKLPRIARREKLFLSADQVRTLADVIDPRYRTLVLVLAYGGLRWGEAAALRRKHCDLVRSRVHVMESLSDVSGTFYWVPTKTYQQASVVVPAFLRDLLAAQLRGMPEDPEALLFTAPGGGPLRIENFRRRVWFPALEAASLPGNVRIHDLRHTCAALLIADRAQAKEVQAHLRHSTIAVTFDHYGHLFEQKMQELAEGLDRTFRESRAHQAPTTTGGEMIEPGTDEGKDGS